MRMIKETARTMMSSALMSDNKLARFWFYSVQHACTVWNQLPRGDKNVAPSKAVFGKGVDYKLFVVFGSPGFSRTEKKTALQHLI